MSTENLKRYNEKENKEDKEKQEKKGAKEKKKERKKTSLLLRVYILHFSFATMTEILAPSLDG